MGKDRSSGSTASPAACRPTGALGAHRRCIALDQCSPDPPSSAEALPKEPRAAGEAGGFHPRAAARRVPAPTPRSVPRQCHLQTQTPDECLKITMLPGLPLSFFLMHVGRQPIGRSDTLPTGAHWLGGLAGAGSEPQRRSPLVSWQAGVQLCVNPPGLQQGLWAWIRKPQINSKAGAGAGDQVWIV